MEICCKSMESFIDDPRDPLDYNPIFREYYIKIHDRAVIITLVYCPWCGLKLPTSLRDEYFDILYNDYKLDISLSDCKTHPGIPKEFKSEAWWKKRNL